MRFCRIKCVGRSTSKITRMYMIFFINSLIPFYCFAVFLRGPLKGEVTYHRWINFYVRFVTLGLIKLLQHCKKQCLGDHRFKADNKVGTQVELWLKG